MIRLRYTQFVSRHEVILRSLLTEAKIDFKRKIVSFAKTCFIVRSVNKANYYAILLVLSVFTCYKTYKTKQTRMRIVSKIVPGF